MSTFYLLPSRPVLGERFAQYLRGLFPGLHWSSQAWDELAETLARVAGQQPDVYVVYRAELPAEEDPTNALRDGYGAAAGDEIVEVRPGESGAIDVQRWRLGEAQPGN